MFTEQKLERKIEGVKLVSRLLRYWLIESPDPTLASQSLAALKRRAANAQAYKTSLQATKYK